MLNSDDSDSTETQLMSKHPCGIPNVDPVDQRKKRYALFGNRWRAPRNITVGYHNYSTKLSTRAQDDAALNAITVSSCLLFLKYYTMHFHHQLHLEWSQ